MEPASKRLRVLAQQTQPVEVSNPVVVFSGTRCRGSARLWSRYVSSPTTRVGNCSASNKGPSCRQSVEPVRLGFTCAF
jgi:hypothetical protein